MTNRPTLARWMTWIAVLALNAALLRAFLVQEMFIGVILLFATLQLALWRWLRTRRRFWLGFIVGGVAVTLLLFAGETFEIGAINDWATWYEQTSFTLLEAPLPDPVLDFMENR